MHELLRTAFPVARNLFKICRETRDEFLALKGRDHRTDAYGFGVRCWDKDDRIIVENPERVEIYRAAANKLLLNALDHTHTLVGVCDLLTDTELHVASSSNRPKM